MLKPALTIALLSLILVSVGRAATAPLETYLFSGTAIGSSLDGSGSGLASLTVNVGDTVTGSFVLDRSILDANTADPTVGVYNHVAAPHLVRLLIGGATIDVPGYPLVIHDNITIGGEIVDLFEVNDLSGAATMNGDPIFITAGDIDFVRAPSGTLVDDSLPTASTLSAWPGRVVLSLIGQPSDRQLTVEITEVRLATLSAMIDIKPNDIANMVSLSSQGVLAVALLGTDTIDVTSVTPSSIRLQGVAMTTRGPEKAPKLAFSLEDVNVDGTLDLIAFFSIHQLADLGALTLNTTELVLTAMLTDGSLIEGSDVVVVH